MFRCLLLAAALQAAAPVAAATFSAAEMLKLKRLSDPQISPDGHAVLYSVADFGETEADVRNDDLWLVPLVGGEPRRLTNHPQADKRGRFSPDGRRVAFLSNRGGSQQLYALDLRGGEARQISSLAAEAQSFAWIDEQTLLLVARVYPECTDAVPTPVPVAPPVEPAPSKGDPIVERQPPAGPTYAYDDACNRRRSDQAATGSLVRRYDSLLYRHWDGWRDGRRSHLLVIGLDGKVQRDLTPGERDVPPFSLSGPDDFAVSPDGREVAYAVKNDAQPALSTNAELFVVPTAGGVPKLVSGSPGYDGAPRYSPDGRLLAFRAQMRAGYESDRWRLLVYDRESKAVRNLTEDFDRHVGSVAWSHDSKTLYFTAAEAGQAPVYSVPAEGGLPRKVADGHFDQLQAAPDGKQLVMTKDSLTHPPEVYRFELGRRGILSRVPSRLVNLSQANDAELATFALKEGESVTYKGAGDQDVQAWIVKPASFDAARRYPLLVLIHGGPQGVWPDGWSFRWNAQVFANAGYVVFMPNPRGSFGFGQAFVDEINADWGGRAYEDVMKGTDFAETLPYVDFTRTAAAGASYGGYLVDWIAGHTGRYRALVSHDGVFDLASMYGATEELWFPEWEFKGPYWEQPELYARWSPSAHVANLQTPMLVIHGERDYRVPLEQSLGLFTALQRRGVPSRLLVFPDEGHWVQAPVNALVWYQEVVAWLDRWTKSP